MSSYENVEKLASSKCYLLCLLDLCVTNRMRSEIRVRAGVDALNVQSERETLDLKVWFKGDL